MTAAATVAMCANMLAALLVSSTVVGAGVGAGVVGALVGAGVTQFASETPSGSTRAVASAGLTAAAKSQGTMVKVLLLRSLVGGRGGGTRADVQWEEGGGGVSGEHGV